MTSSLVGSEMCIRDSAKRAVEPALRDGERERKLAQENARKMQEEIENPVSYTHLTLPTICSV
eukprot:11807125-Prorocentrum_lima.AAC.1